MPQGVYFSKYDEPVAVELHCRCKAPRLVREYFTAF